jgi:microcin C transport system ATP-binding protein
MSRSTSTSTPLIDVKGLRVAFGDKEVVHGIDFQIGAGEKLALVGESGSGKTVTALSLLQLVQNADVSGAAKLAGGERPQDVRDLISIPERQLLRHPRQGDRDDLPGADDRAECALHRGRPDCRGAELQEGLSARAAHAAARAAAGRHGHFGAGAARPGVSAPAVGRPAAARHDRHGPGLQATVAAGG